MSRYMPTIHAWKPHGDSYLSHCDLDDPAATRFDIRTSSTTLEFESRYQAEQVAHALAAAVEMGKNLAFTELRKFIGAAHA